MYDMCDKKVHLYNTGILDSWIKPNPYVSNIQ